MSLDFVILGLSITSAWANGHATTYRGLVRELVRRGHQVLFLERDVPWYADNRDMPRPPYGETQLYRSLEELKDRFAAQVREADVVMVGSYVPEGIDVGRWINSRARGVTAFYDIDTPVTLTRLERRECEYLDHDLIPCYDLYLSFTGGPVLRRLERDLGARAARPLYCSVDPDLYQPEPATALWDLGYLGTYSDDRQPMLAALMLDAAREWPDGKFVVAGPQYPDSIQWPDNVQHIENLSPREHGAFYNSQRFTLNVSPADGVRAGWSPSLRLFEAAACGVPVVSDVWAGLDGFFEPGREILLTHGTADTLRLVRETDDDERRAVGLRARERVLREHTPAHRAEEMELHVAQVRRSAACKSG